MTDKVHKMRQEVEKRFEQIKNSERESDSGAFYQLKELLEFIDSLQEEPVSEDLNEAVTRIIKETSKIPNLSEYEALYHCAVEGAQWQKEHLWKPADGDDLPEIDREVIALLDNGKVVFAHRPPEYWDGKNIVTGKVTRHYPKTYDKDGWNIPNVKYWLDCLMQKEIEL